MVVLPIGEWGLCNVAACLCCSWPRYPANDPAEFPVCACLGCVAAPPYSQLGGARRLWHYVLIIIEADSQQRSAAAALVFAQHKFALLSSTFIPVAGILYCAA